MKIVLVTHTLITLKKKIKPNIVLKTKKEEFLAPSFFVLFYTPPRPAPPLKIEK